MYSIFKSCSEMEHIDLSNFDTSNVTNMGFIFKFCHKLKKIKGINNLITSKVIDMGGMFQGCFELESLDLSSFDTSNVITMQNMFNTCFKLKKIIGLDKFITNKVTNI